jgi:nucleotide-binding universal stress UspA family protein
MNILVPVAHSRPDHSTVDYVINIAERLNAQLVVLRVLTGEETDAVGEKSLRLFIKGGKEKKVPVNAILRRGGIASVIIEFAEEASVDLIIFGVSHGEIAAEWMNGMGMEKTDIPVVMIPKWVTAGEGPSPNE